MNPIYSGGNGSRFSSAVDSPRSGPTPNSRYINVNQSPEAGPDRFQFPSVHSNTSGMFFQTVMKTKVGCVLPMFVLSLLSHAEFGTNDHREKESHFIYKKCLIENI